MEDNSINKMLSNALIVNKDKIDGDSLKRFVSNVKCAIETYKDNIIKANEIDKKNNNGFDIDFNVLINILNNLQQINLFYGDVICSSRDEEKKIIYGKQIMDVGNVIVISNGGPYVTFEMAIRNILAGNTCILVNNSYMYGTISSLISIIHLVLEDNNLPKNLVQLYVDENYDVVLSNFANIDLVVCIGDCDLQHAVLKKARNRVIVTGYENYDLYIEDNTHLRFLNEIIKTDLNIQPYINKASSIEHPKAIMVDDIEEAIAQINYSGSKYSAAIFTSSPQNASKFIKGVKSNIVTVNTSPTIERILDIKQTDLTREKTIIYPLSHIFDGTSIQISSNDLNGV